PAASLRAGARREPGGLLPCGAPARARRPGSSRTVRRVFRLHQARGPLKGSFASRLAVMSRRPFLLALVALLSFLVTAPAALDGVPDSGLVGLQLLFRKLAVTGT